MSIFDKEENMEPEGSTFITALVIFLVGGLFLFASLSAGLGVGLLVVWNIFM